MPVIRAAESAVQKTLLTFFGVLRADASVAVESGRAAAADVSDMWRPAIDALNPGEAGPAGTCCRHVHRSCRDRTFQMFLFEAEPLLAEH